MKGSRKYVAVSCNVSALLLLAFIIWCRQSTSVADFYAAKIYPVISSVLSRLASPFRFSLTEFAVVAIVLLFIFNTIRAVRRKDSWLKCLHKQFSLVLWVYIWLYAAWGLNYFRSSIYARTGTMPLPYEEAEFHAFLKEFSEQLNENWCPAAELERIDIKDFENFVKDWYGELPSEAGLCRPLPWQHPKRLTFNKIYSGAGVLGFIGPAFDEMHVNRDITALEHPFVFAHEYAHVLGVSSEAEANFWAFEATRSSGVKAVRYSAWYSLLSSSWNNINSLLGDEDFKTWAATLRPEILDDLYNTSRYWHGRRWEWLSEQQSRLYNFFLKNNNIAEGTKNYGQVLRMVLSLSDLHGH